VNLLNDGGIGSAFGSALYCIIKAVSIMKRYLAAQEDKGIGSRDLHICFRVSIDRSDVPTSYIAVRSFVFVSNFSIFASRRRELTL
jgi:hypothetical protein